jgi:carbonic anhydrase
MQSLIDHARVFHEHVSARSEQFTALKSNVVPQAMFISCSDARVVPSLITGAGPGDLFELRTAGNVIPPYRRGRLNAEAAAIEYATEVLGVQDLVICGHNRCGAVHARISPQTLRSAPVTRFWLLHTHQWRGIPTPGHGDPGRLHLIAQMNKLRRYPNVARRVSAGRLRVHGWFYEVDTGAVWRLQSGTGSFVPL